MEKYILVTGAFGGIGRALIPLLLEKSYRVVALDKYCDPSIANIIPLICDLGDPSDINKALSKDSALWREKLYGLVHLAGIYPNKTYTDYSVELWDDVMNINVRSLFCIVNYLLSQGVPALRNIVIASSTAARVGSRDPAYAASKSALLGLSKNLSLLLQDHNVRVNSILPGIIDTPMSKAQSDERRAYHASKTLANKIGKPEEVAAVIAFLLSSESSYIWGAEIMINGGMTF